jgi:hypothetical protein
MIIEVTYKGVIVKEEYEDSFLNQYGKDKAINIIKQEIRDSIDCFLEQSEVVE